MTRHLDDADLIDRLEQAFSGVAYLRPVESLQRRRTRTPFALASAVIATGTVIATSPFGSGSDSYAYGWTPEAENLTTEDEARAYELCDSSLPNNHELGTGVLDSYDARGNTVVVTVHGSEGTALCTVDTASEPWTLDYAFVIAESSGTTLSATWLPLPRQDSSMIMGTTPLEATAVEIVVEGLPVFTVEAHGGVYATWAPVPVDQAVTVSARALNADGSTIGEVTEAPAVDDSEMGWPDD